MRITPDTNILVRLLVKDHPEQSPAARDAILAAEAIALPLPTLCELAWVLRHSYRHTPAKVASMLRVLTDSEDAICDRPAVAVGLSFLERGGDFADGVIAFDGARLGAPTFVSFDRQAVALVRGDGGTARLP